MRINTRLSPHAQVQFRVPERRSLGTRLSGTSLVPSWAGPGNVTKCGSDVASLRNAELNGGRN